jgi:hypothetical protein
MNYLIFGGVGFAAGLIPSFFCAIDKGSYNKSFGWFFDAPYFFLNSITSCSGEDCMGNAFLTLLFWPVLGLIVGLLLKIISRK